MGVQTMSVQFWVIVGLMVLAIALLGSFLASLYRKAARTKPSSSMASAARAS